MKYSVLVIAAGSAAAQGKSYKRALARFKGDKSVLDHTVSVFLEDDDCEQVVIVLSPADLAHVVKSQHKNGKLLYVKGGETRMESVFIGLTAVSEEIVLIHDGVRPWIREGYIEKLLSRMNEEKACVLAIRPKGSLRRVKDGYLQERLSTTDLVLLQTPQAYHTNVILRAYQKALGKGLNYYDDSEVLAAVSDVKIAVEEGDLRNTRFLLKKQK